MCTDHTARAGQVSIATAIDILLEPIAATVMAQVTARRRDISHVNPRPRSSRPACLCGSHAGLMGQSVVLLSGAAFTSGVRAALGLDNRSTVSDRSMAVRTGSTSPFTCKCYACSEVPVLRKYTVRIRAMRPASSRRAASVLEGRARSSGANPPPSSGRGMWEV